jgi:hypothetical protein
MEWHARMPNLMLEILNTFLIKGVDIYFGHKDKVYVISKKLIVYVFGVCADGYVEKSKGQIGKSLAIQALHNCRLAPTNCFVISGIQKVWVCHILLDILLLYLSFIRRKRSNI